MGSTLDSSAASPPAHQPSRVHVAGALLLILVLPPCTYYFWLCFDTGAGALLLPQVPATWHGLWTHFPWPTSTSVILYGSWLGLQVFLQSVMPGPQRLGSPLATGARLAYTLNGWRVFWCTWLVLLGATTAGWVSPTVIYDHFGPLLTTAHIVAFTLSGALYYRGRRAGEARSNAIYAYYMGVERHPRLGRFDIKFFCESRPGLILWTVCNASLAAKQHQLYGHVTIPMLLVNALQFLYVADYFWHEEAILSTWDIKHERLGWMLCWGSLVWVPFTYTLQAHYLVHQPHGLSGPAVSGIVALNMLGYAIFRSANLQKHAFRQHPEGCIWGKPPTYIRTARGPLLLTAGWWGLARHCNYLGDLCMALAWCLPTGVTHPLPYFYFVYCTVLLVYRERRDHACCQAHYGADWETYCARVPWRIVPGIY